MNGPDLAAWDTNVISRAVPGSEAAATIAARAEAGTPIAVPAVAWSEVVAGYEHAARRGVVPPSLRAAHAWQRNVVSSGDVEVLSLDELAARALGTLRGRTSLQRSKTWDRDAAIAATCWAHGYAVVTRNVHDFESLAEIIRQHVGGPLLHVAAAV